MQLLRERELDPAIDQRGMPAPSGNPFNHKGRKSFIEERFGFGELAAKYAERGEMTLNFAPWRPVGYGQDTPCTSYSDYFET
jgi:hypothetical protein